MAREHNFLLGRGERLAHFVQVPKAGGKKDPPYDFPTARDRISERLARVDATISALPDDACPRGEAVAVVTLHPRFLSKSDFPTELFKTVGLRAVGSRSRTVKPERWGIDKHESEAITEEIFVAGARTAFHRWAESVAAWTPATRGAADLGHIEELSAFEPKSKLRAIPPVEGVFVLDDHQTIHPRA